MSLFSRISAQDRVDFAKSLSVMLKSGITIDESLTILAEQYEQKPLGKVIVRVRDSIEGGTRLSTSFEKEKKVFGPIFIGLIKAGEESGTLQKNLEFLSELLERSNDLRREVNSATLYPKLVFGAALLLGGGLAVFILPRLVPLFTELDVELPFITKILLDLSLFVQNFWLQSILFLIAFVVGIILLNRIFVIKRFFHTLYLRLPLIGSMIKNYQLTLMTQLFGALIKSGLSINESIPIISSAVTNVNYQLSIKDMEKDIEGGRPLSHSMKARPEMYPKIITNIVSVGEKSGTLSDSFDYLAEYYNKEVSAQAKRLPTIIEPLLLVLIAFVVGFVALAVIMPIYKITGSITR